MSGPVPSPSMNGMIGWLFMRDSQKLLKTLWKTAARLRHRHAAVALTAICTTLVRAAPRYEHHII
jgi:hypothetical protein